MNFVLNHLREMKEQFERDIDTYNKLYDHGLISQRVYLNRDVAFKAAINDVKDCISLLED